MSFKPVSNTLINIMCEMFDAGTSIYTISEELMLDRNTVYKYLLREGRVVPDPEIIAQGRKRFTDEERAEAVKLYKQGMAVKEISERIGMSVPSIYHHVKKETSVRITPKKDFDRAIKWYLEKRYTVQDILDKTGVPRTSFYKELRERRSRGEIN